jgi:hypothetical protein
LFVPPPELEEDSSAGEAARKRTGDHFNYHARFEFNIPGITFGGRYDGSPIIVADHTQPPADRPNDYVASACPGGRAPHLWLADGRSLYDTFGFDFTLLKLGTNHEATSFETAAKALEVPLSVVSVTSDEARDIYQADLTLIRPDQIVAWRGNSAAVLRQAAAHG